MKAGHHVNENQLTIYSNVMPKQRQNSPLCVEEYADIGVHMMGFIVSGSIVFLFLSFLRSVSADVTRLEQERATKILMSAADCAASFEQSNCEVDGFRIWHATPEVDLLCKEWFTCSLNGVRLLHVHSSSVIWAEVLGKFFNHFSKVVDIKAFILPLAYFLTLAPILRAINGMWFHLFKQQKIR